MPNGQGSAAPSKLPLPIRHRGAPNMATPGRPRNATTPRRSFSQPPNTNETSLARLAPQQTPRTNDSLLRASAPPSSNPRFSIRTPGSQLLDFRASRQQAFTPHGRAAIRTLDSRRAAITHINTPGRNRRRSVRDTRETPRDVLRALSKTLAPKSKTVSTSSSSSPDDRQLQAGGGRRRGDGGSGTSKRKKRGPVVIPEDPEDSDDEFPIDRPRFSLPIDEADDSDGDLPRPPRSSGLEDLDDNFTMQSIELPRRATLGQRYSMRMSDYGPMGEPPSDNDDVGIDSAFFPRANFEEDMDGGTGIGDAGDVTLERVDDEAARRDTLGGRISDFGTIGFDLDAGDQSTVILAPQVQSSPARDSFSPENEPFAVDDEPPPFGEDMDVDDNLPVDFGSNEPLDFGVEDDVGEEGEEEHEHEQEGEVGDQTSESLVANRQVSRSAHRVKKPGKKISRHGIEYPSLPPSVVKRLAQRFAGRTKISSDTLSAIMQASEWFFEQLGDDLAAYANHAGNKTIDESDMLTLMRRQRQTSSSSTPFALAQRHLPRELLQDLRMPPPAPVKSRRRRKRPSSDGEKEGMT